MNHKETCTNIATGWDQYPTPSVKDLSIQQILEVLQDRVLEETPNGRTTFLCPLHGGGSEDVATMRHAGDPTDPDSYLVHCDRCGSKDREVTRKFESWLSAQIPEIAAAMYSPHIDPSDGDTSVNLLKYICDAEGLPMLYEAEIHVIYGEPGTMKSFWLLSALTDVDVRYWDFENLQPELKRRLELLAIPKERRKVFKFPETREDILKLVDEYRVTKPELVIVDGMSGLAATFGVNTDDNFEVERLFNEVFVPLKRAGIAVAFIDHLPKDLGNDTYPIGAQKKKSLSSVAYLFKRRKNSDRIDVFVTKDRAGTLYSRCDNTGGNRLYGWLETSGDESPLTVTVQPDLVAIVDGAPMESYDVALRSRVMKFVASAPRSSKKAIESNVEGKSEAIRLATDWLVDHGYLQQEQQASSRLHTVLREFVPTWQPRWAA